MPSVVSLPRGDSRRFVHLVAPIGSNYYSSSKRIKHGASRRRAATRTTQGHPASTPHRRQFSVSQTEVEKFNAMHANWWNPTKNPLMGMNATRVLYIRQQIAAQRETMTWNNNNAKSGKNTTTTASNETLLLPPLANVRALDIGCGGGLLSESLTRLGAQVTGIDPSVDLVAAAQDHAVNALHQDDLERLTYVNTTAELLAQEQPASFDVVCLLEVIEHVRHPHDLLQAAATLLKPDGGMLFLSTMSRTIKAHFLTITAPEYILGLLPVGTHDWHLYRSPAEVRPLVQACGLNQVDATGMVLQCSSLLPLSSYQWRLDPNDTDANWIGCYVKM